MFTAIDLVSTLAIVGIKINALSQSRIMAMHGIYQV